MQIFQPFCMWVAVFQFAWYNIIQLWSMLIICFAPSYWCFHAQVLKESLFFHKIWTSCVGVFLTAVQHLKLFSITRRRDILKDNITIFHTSSSGYNWFRCCQNWLVEVTTKFRRFGVRMWIQNDKKLSYQKIC